VLDQRAFDAGKLVESSVTESSLLNHGDSDLHRLHHSIASEYNQYVGYVIVEHVMVVWDSNTLPPKSGDSVWSRITGNAIGSGAVG